MRIMCSNASHFSEEVQPNRPLQKQPAIAIADKSTTSRQHARMRITCPHCQTIYQLQAVDAETTLICHRCNTEFSLAQLSKPAQTTHPVDEKKNTSNLLGPSATTETNASADKALESEKSIQISKHIVENKTTETFDKSEPDAMLKSAIIPAQEIAASGETSTKHDPRSDETTNTSQETLPPTPPQRAKAHIMPWLFTILLIIAGSGFWMNQDTWLDDPWLRSVLINIGLDIQVRNKDWYIDPQSVEMTWLERTHSNTTVLVITGEVYNLLQSDLPPPAIHFTLYGRDNPDTHILERDLIITRPPLMQTIRKTPYTPPPKDIIAVGPLGKRGFILVLENMPQNAGNFTLSPLAR